MKRQCKTNQLFKKVTAIIMAAGMTISLAGCGGDAKNTATDNTASQGTQTDNSQTQADNTTGGDESISQDSPYYGKG